MPEMMSNAPTNANSMLCQVLHVCYDIMLFPALC